MGKVIHGYQHTMEYYDNVSFYLQTSMECQKYAYTEDKIDNI